MLSAAFDCSFCQVRADWVHLAVLRGRRDLRRASSDDLRRLPWVNSLGRAGGVGGPRFTMLGREVLSWEAIAAEGRVPGGEM